MNPKNNNIEDRLQDYLDDRVQEDELTDLFNESAEKQQELILIRETDKLLKSIKAQEPPSGFVSKVMSHLDDKETYETVSKQGFIITLGVLLVLAISGIYLNTISPEVLELPKNITLIGKDITVNKFTSLIEMSVIIKGLLFLTFFLAMLLFDRAVLKPFFHRKKEFA